MTSSRNADNPKWRFSYTEKLLGPAEKQLLLKGHARKIVARLGKKVDFSVTQPIIPHDNQENLQRLLEFELISPEELEQQKLTLLALAGLFLLKTPDPEGMFMGNPAKNIRDILQHEISDYMVKREDEAVSFVNGKEARLLDEEFDLELDRVANGLSVAEAAAESGVSADMVLAIREFIPKELGARNLSHAVSKRFRMLHGQQPFKKIEDEDYLVNQPQLKTLQFLSLGFNQDEIAAAVISPTPQKTPEQARALAVKLIEETSKIFDAKSEPHLVRLAINAGYLGSEDDSFIKKLEAMRKSKFAASNDDEIES